MKKIFLFLAGALIAFTSCNLGDDGDAYLNINYGVNGERSPISIIVSYDDEFKDGDEIVVVPRKLNCPWDSTKYYLVEPGIYYVDWQYQARGKDVDMYQCKIEIWINAGRTKRRDGDDVYFQLTLHDYSTKRDNGAVDFTHEEVAHQKSYNLQENVDGKIFLYDNVVSQGQYVMKYEVYQITKK
jgi:hypothetical protein